MGTLHTRRRGRHFLVDGMEVVEERRSDHNYVHVGWLPPFRLDSPEVIDAFHSTVDTFLRDQDAAREQQGA